MSADNAPQPRDMDRILWAMLLREAAASGRLDDGQTINLGPQPDPADPGQETS